MSYRESLRLYLEGDATLSVILTGGIFDDEEMPADGGGMGSAPMSADGLDMLPFAVVVWKGAVPAEIVRYSQREFVEIWLYQERGYDALVSAQRRIQMMLDGWIDPVSHCGYFWAESKDNLPADEYDNAAAAMLRFYVNQTRRNW